MKYSRNINSMIMAAMKGGEKVKADTYKLLKAEFLKSVTAKGAKVTDINELPDDTEVSIVKKMIKERTDSATLYTENGRKDLAEKETTEMNYLKELLPKEATKEEVLSAINDYITENGEFERKQMGSVVKYVKSKFENVDGKLVADCINSHLNS